MTHQPNYEIPGFYLFAQWPYGDDKVIRDPLWVYQHPKFMEAFKISLTLSLVVEAHGERQVYLYQRKEGG